MNTIIFDGDDTLWVTQKFYTECRENFYQYLVNSNLANRDEAHELFGEIDKTNIITYGFSPTRFGQSMVDTYVHLVNKVGFKSSKTEMARVRAIGDAVFESVLPLYPDTLDVLNSLSDYKLFLYTAGDDSVQRRKIKKLDIQSYFQDVKIVPQKDVPTLRSFMNEADLDIDDSWMVGNSLKSDMEPALALGLKCIWIETDAWEIDKSTIDTNLLYRVSSLTEARQIINEYGS